MDSGPEFLFDGVPTPCVAAKVDPGVLDEDQKRVLSLFTKNGLSVKYARECMLALKTKEPSLKILLELKNKGLVETGYDSLGNRVIRRKL